MGAPRASLTSSWLGRSRPARPTCPCCGGAPGTRPSGGGRKRIGPGASPLGNCVNIVVNNSKGQKMEPTVERWRVIRGFEGYMVSDLGRVKAVERQCRHVSKSKTESCATRKEKTLTPSMDGCRIPPRQAEQRRQADPMESASARRQGVPPDTTGASTAGRTQAPSWSTTLTGTRPTTAWTTWRS